jgi:hypothetical protein
MGFKEKVEEFLKNSTPTWHVSYDQFTFRLRGLHPKNPETDENRVPMMHTKVKLLDEDQLHLVEEIQQHGLFHYEVNKDTLKVVRREKTSLSLSPNDYGSFSRIEFVPSLDLNNIDAGISILIAAREVLFQLLTSDAKAELSNLRKIDPSHKIRLYITEYNNPNRLLDTLIVPLAEFSEDGIFKHSFDASHLPEDVSIYYNKIFQRINFEIK